MEIDDRQLEEALAGYSRHAPPPGVEQRILARLTSHRSKPKWMLPASVFAAVCLAVTVTTSRREKTPVALPLPTLIAAAVVVPPAVVPVPHREPRRDRFPSPAPLTNEERAWMALSDSGVLASLPQGDIEPIRIEELTIPPLESVGGE